MNLEKEIFDIALQDIIPNRFQPREIFNDDELSELSESIKQHGVIQPIIVRKVGDKYEIIAGERRYRASQLAGKQTIPALVRDIDDKEAAKIALLENLQRSNLTPIEEAKTYQTILKIDNITQDELAQNLGKSQSAIANKLRLLSLNEEVQTALLNSQISERHARSLLGLTDKEQLDLLHKTINEKLTVRQLDEEILKTTGKAPGVEETEEQEGGINMDMTENSLLTPNQETTNEPNISSASELLNTTIPGLESNNEVQSPIIPETNLNNEAPAITPEPENNLNVNSIFPKVELPNQEEKQEEQITPELNINSVNENIGLNTETPMEQATTIELPKIELPNQEENKEEIVTPELNTNNIEINIPKVEDTTVQELPKREENIFDKLRVTREETPQENKFDLPTPDLSAVINTNPEPVQQEPQENTYDNIYDLRFAINNFRQAVQNTEKFGFKVNATENDLEDKYQIVIEIDKK